MSEAAFLMRVLSTSSCSDGAPMLTTMARITTASISSMMVNPDWRRGVRIVASAAPLRRRRLLAEAVERQVAVGRLRADGISRDGIGGRRAGRGGRDRDGDLVVRVGALRRNRGAVPALRGDVQPGRGAQR